MVLPNWEGLIGTRNDKLIDFSISLRIVLVYVCWESFLFALSVAFLEIRKQTLQAGNIPGDNEDVAGPDGLIYIR